MFDHLADNVADEAILSRPAGLEEFGAVIALVVAACRAGPDGDPPAALRRVADAGPRDSCRWAGLRWSGGGQYPGGLAYRMTAWLPNMFGVSPDASGE